jgi:hypothetical protein
VKNKDDIISFALGFFAGLILLSMLLGQLKVTPNVSIIVGGCALGLTIWQGWIARKNYMLSQRPLLSSELTYSDNGFIYTVTNKGNGTALITNHIAYICKVPCSPSELRYDFQLIQKSYGFLKISPKITVFSDCSCLQKGESATLIGIEFKQLLSDKEIKEIISRYGFRIGYKSFYGEQFVV